MGASWHNCRNRTVMSIPEDGLPDDSGLLGRPCASPK